MLIKDFHSLWIFALLPFVGSMLALYRMDRFAQHYAREIFIQFLELPNKDEKKEEPKKFLIELSK